MKTAYDLYDWVKMFLKNHTALIALIAAIGYAGTDTFIKTPKQPLTKPEIQKIITDTVTPEYIDKILSP